MQKTEETDSEAGQPDAGTGGGQIPDKQPGETPGQTTEPEEPEGAEGQPEEGTKVSGPEGEPQAQENGLSAQQATQGNARTFALTASVLERQVLAAQAQRANSAAAIGTEGNPFSIASEEALRDMQEKIAAGKTYEIDGVQYNYSSAAYRLDADIALSDSQMSPITGVSAGFVFDGNGCRISGLKDSLFNTIVADSVVRNLTVEGNIAGLQWAGMMCVYNEGIIDSCTAEGSITGGEYAAGFACDNYGTISNCTSQVNIEGTAPLAGVSVYCYDGSVISGCENTGAVRGNYMPADYYSEPVGGITAIAQEGVTIENCTNSGSISNDDGDYGQAGGIIGYATVAGVQITGCSNSGRIQASAGQAGGIVGYGIGVTADKCSNSGNVTSGGQANPSGGIFGYAEQGSIASCYNTGAVSASGVGGQAGGIAGWIKGQEVRACWNSGEIRARDAGGVCGQIGYSNDNCLVQDCYNTGKVTGESVIGGIGGQIMSGGGSIVNCYNTGNVAAVQGISSPEIGGICGRTQSSELVKDCYALNEYVHEAKTTLGRRILRWHPDTLESNYAWDQMLINGSIVEADNQDKGADKPNGADITSEQLMDEENSAGLFGTFTDDIWIKQNGALPILSGVGEDMQSSDMPAYIVAGKAEETGEMTVRGSGTADDPYKIASAEEWCYFSQKMNDTSERAEYLKASYILENDIDLSEVRVSSAGNSTYYAFTGNLDGQYHTISGLSWDNDTSGKGLFGNIGENGVVENLNIQGSGNATNSIALLAARNDGTIRNCKVEGRISISSSSSGRYAGGIAADNRGTIENCSADMTIIGTGTQPYLGGIAGYNNNGKIYNCYSTGSIQGETTKYAGGIVGYQSGSSSVSEHCYSTMDVAAQYAGGIAGNAYAGSVSSCVALGETISASKDSQAGRIAAQKGSSATLSDNLAWSGMKNSGDVLISDILAGAADNKNGQDISAEDIAGTAMWSDAGFASDIWRIQDGKLPVLAYEDNDRVLPDHLKVKEPVTLTGAGTQENPYEIGTLDELLYAAEQMQNEEAYRGASYRLTADIDLSGVTWNAIGTADTPFTGTFDGADHRISNLSMQINAQYQGFFGVAEGAHITGLILQGKVVAGADVGGLVGYAKEGTLIERCQVKVDVQGWPGLAGGIAGVNEGTILNCIQTGNVQGVNGAGGIAGTNASSGVIEHTYSIGTLKAQGTEAAGIAVVNEGAVRYCAALEEEADAAAGGAVAKIALHNTGVLEGNYAWSEMKITGTLAEDADDEAGMNGKDSAVTIIAADTVLFPEDVWVLREGYYPMLIGQTDMNYILPHQAANGREIIESLDITLPKPAAGDVPVTSLAGDGWTAKVEWSPKVTGTFAYDTVYTATVTLTLNTGYVLADDAVITLNGEKAEIVRNDDGTVTLTYKFGKTEKKPAGSGTGSDGSGKDGSAAETGDSAPIAATAAILLISLAGIAALRKRRSA